jgi:phage-related baseplate assembly protein
MSVYTPIDLSTLPAPDVVEALSFESIFAAMLSDLRTRDATFDALVESDPAYKILEVAAYRELLIRQRVNDAARAVMLAYSGGADLENLGALFGVTRKTITPANPNSVPPTAAVMESDSSLRYRIQLALEGLSTAGPVGAYQFHALSVEGVKDAAVAGPPDTDPGVVRVTLLGTEGDGAVDSSVIAEVEAVLNDEDVRPLTDTVEVQSATITTFEVIATLYINQGPDPLLVRDAALASVQEFVDKQHKVGADIRLSALYAALHVAGVDRVVLSAPGVTSDLVIDGEHAPYCTDITLSTAPA